MMTNIYIFNIKYFGATQSEPLEYKTSAPHHLVGEIFTPNRTNKRTKNIYGGEVGGI